LNLQQILQLTLPLPPKSEQVALNEMLQTLQQSLDEQAAAISYSLKQVASQRKNILKAAFAGQLVPQDPDDEPASVLLERIRAERDSLDKDGASNRRKRKSYA
jgi:type I restriction enzyme S subunit